MNTKEYRMEIKVKNNLLYKKIYDTYGSVKKFCEVTGISIPVVIQFLNFKRELYNKRNGELKDSVKKLLDIFKCPLNELFPENYKVIETNKHVREVSQQEIEAISMQSPELQLLTYDINSEIEQTDLRNNIEKILSTLLPIESEVIRLRYLDGYTLEETGKRIGISRTRVDQIAKKAIRKMTHPSRSKLLKEYAGDRNIMTSRNAYDPHRLASLAHEDELILPNYIRSIFKNILNIDNMFYKIDEKVSVKFKFGLPFNILQTETAYTRNRCQVGGDYWHFPIEIAKETADPTFNREHHGEYVKIIYHRRAEEHDKQINHLFRQLINTFIDLCKSSIGTEITKDCIIMPRSEFRKLKNKIDEFSKLVTINQN